jgi:hypothetical protein
MECLHPLCILGIAFRWVMQNEQWETGMAGIDFENPNAIGF